MNSLIVRDQESLLRSIAVMALPLSIQAYPACFCVPSTPWEDRKFDGIWDTDTWDPGAPALESRTCECCGATKSIEVPT